MLRRLLAPLLPLLVLLLAPEAESCCWSQGLAYPVVLPWPLLLLDHQR